MNIAWKGMLRQMRLHQISLLFLILITAGIAKIPLDFARAAPSVDILIDDYRKAVELNDPEEIEQTRKALREYPQAIYYLKFYHPGLYEKYLKGEAKINQGQPVDHVRESWNIRDRALAFPIQDRRDNRAIALSEPNEGRWDNRKIAMNFPNQNRPSNRELIEQRKRQDQDREAGSPLAGPYLIGKPMIISISGVDSSEREALKAFLSNDFKTITAIREIRFKQGVIEFEVTLDSNPEDFSQRLEQKKFGPFQLDLVTFYPYKIDYVLRGL